MKKFLVIFVLLLYPLSFFISPSHVRAEAVKPIPPFSVEGNPEQDYYFGEIFPLFRYFRPRALEIFENLNRSRTYDDLQVCPGPGSDRRDYECDNQSDGCDGGDVDICHNTLTNQSIAYTAHSTNGSCKLFGKADPNYPDAVIKGRCEYTQTPSVSSKVKGTDFGVKSGITSSSSTGMSMSGLVYPKIQSESLAYTNQGTDNSITWGSQYLNSDPCEIIIRKVTVVRRAKHTKNTVSLTGEWPLGWVDWGYKDQNMTKTLLEIDSELPDPIASQLNPLIEGLDDFYLTAGQLDKVSDISQEKKTICNEVSKARGQQPVPQWLKDLDTAPMYSPSFRMGYLRPSICVWDKCCPTPVCPLTETELLGTKRGLYYDLSVSQAYGAALDNLFMTYPLDQAMKIFNKIVSNNPLVRYLFSAEPQATPSRINAELSSQLKDTCLKYIPWSNWLGFGYHMDYLDSGNFLGPNNTCPDYALMPSLSKETAAATSGSPLDALINLIWNASGKKKVDDVDPVKYHYLSIPDLMSQSIAEIQLYTYDTRDTLSELDSVKDYNNNLSNIVEDSASNLYGGKSMGPANAKRNIELYGCDDPMYSTYLTSIEAYSHGERNGCGGNKDAPVNKCDPAKFDAILADSNWQMPSSAAQAIIKNSAMFVGGVLNLELETAYAAASEKTGVPCEILAAHHFEEASQYFTDGGDPTKYSVANGRLLKEIGQSLEGSAVNAANTVNTHPIGNTKQVIAEMSRFNGGGNANCQLGFLAPIPYGGCPRAFEGEDDPYVTNMLDGKHTNMYLLYCGDFTPCLPPKPYGTDRPGAFAVALVVHDYLKTHGGSISPSASTTPNTTSTGSTQSSSFFQPKTCGEGSLGTALGCLPYTRDAFVSTILSFIVGIAGAIALITMLVATIQIMTAAGDTKKIQSGRDLFSSALTGLLFLIFAVSLLRLIAGDIIKLPGF